MFIVEVEDSKLFLHLRPISGITKLKKVIKFIKRCWQNSLRSLENVFWNINFQYELCAFLICKINIIASLSVFVQDLSH